jgi:hypothetical protein
MSKDQALRLALEALENIRHHFDTDEYAYEVAVKSITAIKQALDHPEEKPVAWTDIDFTNIYISEMVAKEKSADVPLYTSPPKREWQGLTDDEMQKIIKLVAKKCAEIADTAEPYQSADLIRKHFGVEK